MRKISFPLLEGDGSMPSPSRLSMNMVVKDHNPNHTPKELFSADHPRQTPTYANQALGT
jgi:hypothetical protein